MMDGEMRVVIPRIVRDRSAYKNVTVVISENLNGETEVGWVRQEDTEEIAPAEALANVDRI